MKRPSYKRVAKLLRYDPKTGAFHWRVATSGRYAGRVAGSRVGEKTDRHMRVQIDGRQYYASHLAVVLMTGKWPKTMIGFRDGDGTNCRWRNLMATTIKIARRHSRPPRNNRSGHRGVCFHPARRKWYARINVDGREKSLGYYDTKREAVAARRRGAERYGYRK